LRCRAVTWILLGLRTLFFSGNAPRHLEIEGINSQVER
jgi:hypothetical protein